MPLNCVVVTGEFYTLDGTEDYIVVSAGDPVTLLFVEPSAARTLTIRKIGAHPVSLLPASESVPLLPLTFTGETFGYTTTSDGARNLGTSVTLLYDGGLSEGWVVVGASDGAVFTVPS